MGRNEEVRCLVCCQVHEFLASESQTPKPTCLAQSIELPVRKWEIINMDFINGLQRSHRRHDLIKEIVDRMTKSVHFLSIKTTHSVEDYANLYIKVVVRLNGVPVSIILDRGA